MLGYLEATKPPSFIARCSNVRRRRLSDRLGHRNITHTVRYTELSSERFKKFWKD